MARTKFCETLDALGIAHRRVAQLFDVTPRSIRRWQDGSRPIPHGVRILLHLMTVGKVTVAEVEEAAAAIRTSGCTKPGPLVVVVNDDRTAAGSVSNVENDSSSSCPGGTETTALAGPGLSTAEKVLALTAGICRWPVGDPTRPDFCFCGSPVIRKPYCEHHRAMAHAAPPTRQGARGGPPLKMLARRATSSMPDHGVGRGSGLRTAIGKWNWGSELTPRVG